MQRYFIECEKEIQVGSAVYLGQDDSFHAVKVMRMKGGDLVTVCHKSGVFKCEIVSCDTNRVELTVRERIFEKREFPFKVTVAHGLVARGKMEEVLEKGTQMGMHCYQAVSMERSTLKIPKDQFLSKGTRFDKILKEAAEQSRRLVIPEMLSLVNYGELIEQIKNGEFDLVLVAFEGEIESRSLYTCLSSLKETPENVLLVVGPEGGFSPTEINMIHNYAHLVGLGPRILRTEVAPLYMLSVLSFYFEMVIR